MPPKRKFVRIKGRKRKFHRNRFVKVQTSDSSEVSEENKVEESERNTSSSSEDDTASTSVTEEFRALPAQKGNFKMNHRAKMKINVMMDSNL